MRRLTTKVLLVAIALGALAPGVAAQERAPREMSPAARDSLEARVRARMEQMLRSQLGLSDAQLRQLSVTNRRFEGQRRALFQQEREVRGELARLLRDRDTTQDARMSQLLDRTLQLQRQRLDLLEAEQKELSTFLTPTQRARLFGLEEQLRRRTMEMRDRRTPSQRPGSRRPGASPGPTRRPLGAR